MQPVVTIDITVSTVSEKVQTSTEKYCTPLECRQFAKVNSISI